MNYWLMKTEPDVLSIDKLKTLKESDWDGVRNYQARNFMRDQMKLKDKVLIYHSSCDEIGIAGIAEVSKESHPDYSAIDPKSEYFDAKATKENPRWYMVSVKWVQTFSRVISLDDLRSIPDLSEMIVIKKGNRLSITPVTESEYKIIKNLV